MATIRPELEFFGEDVELRKEIRLPQPRRFGPQHGQKCPQNQELCQSGA